LRRDGSKDQIQEDDQNEDAGSWVRVAKLVGVAGLGCGLLVAAAYQSAGKRSPQTRVGVSQVAVSNASKTSATKNEAKWREAYGKLPLSFEETRTDGSGGALHLAWKRLRTLSDAPGSSFGAAPESTLRPVTAPSLGTIRALRKARAAGELTAIRLRLEGANPNAEIEG